MDVCVSQNFPLNQLRSEFSGLLSSPAWSGQVGFADWNEQGLKIRVANLFVRDWVKENHQTRLLEVCRNLSSQKCELFFEVASMPQDNSSTPESGTPVSASETPVSQSWPPGSESPLHTTKFIELKALNPKYRFDGFVVGNSNQFAHAAAMGVAGDPGNRYNPLLVYGGVGLGKTHLMHAIGQEIVKSHPGGLSQGARILYLSSEKFMNELIYSIRFGKMGEFRNKYRDSCDVLLMDDVQFIAGKERTQEEFFHTFNFLHEAHKQIVLSSDRAPKDITDLEGRLRSRLEWGLIADIQPPDLETRVAILKKKARDNHISLDDEVALFLATHIKSNVRELEGALIRVNAFASLTSVRITVAFAKETLKNVLGAVGKVMTVDQIQKIVSDYYGISLGDLTGKRRVRNFAKPRQIAMYLCRKFVKASFPEIGTKFGGKDHSTVVHAVTKITSHLPNDPLLQEQMMALERQLSH